MKHYLSMRLFLLLFISIPFITFSHGFHGATRVWRDDGSVCSLAQLVSESSHNQLVALQTYTIKSENLQKGNIISWRVITASSYCWISFDEQQEHDICCSPNQLFYSEAEREWVCAAHLKVGEALLTAHGTCVAVKNVAHIHETRQLYVVQVSKPHVFVVGHYELVVHNSLVAAGNSAVVLGCGTGASIGTFLGPAGVMGGIVVGGCIAWILSKCNLFSKNKARERYVPDLHSYLESEPSKEANSQDVPPAKTVEDLLNDSELGQEKTFCKQYIRKGGYPQALEDFKSLGPLEVKDLPNGKEGKTGILPDGREINVRIDSSDKRPTLEILPLNKKSKVHRSKAIKIRYGNK